VYDVVVFSHALVDPSGALTTLGAAFAAAPAYK
jgi:hypothetical protein